MAKDVSDTVIEGRFAQGRASAPAQNAARILIVEDEAALSLLLSYNLEAEGFAVERVERGDEAEVRLSETTPDVVILDWMLPGVSGLEICRRIRARAATRTLPVIMLTARGEESERVRGLSIGADDYVVKPFSVPELMARVHALLRRQLDALSHPANLTLHTSAERRARQDEGLSERIPGWGSREFEIADVVSEP